MTAPATPPHLFRVRCCREGGRRIVINGVLVCKHCDAALKIPNGKDAVEVNDHVDLWPQP